VQSELQRLLAEGMASLQDGKRTPEFERLLLAQFDERHREFLRQVLSLKPAYSAGVIREAYAAKAFIESRNQFATDEDCAAYIAATGPLSADAVLKAGKRHRQPVNDLLREMGILGSTKNL
jgi:hypothetical protein